MEYTARLLLTLDSLLDTRAGTLCRMDLDRTAKLLHQPSYAGRIVDQFVGFDQKTFDDLYQKRDIDTLKLSIITPVYAIVHDFIQRSLNKNLDKPYTVIPEIHLNVWPYDIPEVLGNQLLYALASKLPVIPEMKIVNISNKDLTPQILKEKYNTVIKYDFFDWIEEKEIADAITKCAIPEVTFFVPTILKSVDDQLPKDLPKLFEDFMGYFQLHINLIFLPTDVFSTVIAKKITPTSPSGSQSEKLDPDERPATFEELHPLSS